MIFIRDGIPYSSRTDLMSKVCESSCIEDVRPKCKTLLVWTVYRAPDVNLDIFIEDLSHSLHTSEDVHTILLGDFNVDMQTLGKVTNKEQRRKLSKLLSIHNFEQFIADPTRVTETSSTLIDLLSTVVFFHWTLAIIR
ncbi:Hypothetical predicted protein [Paramuricea clavata]|uniref:Uncharacterized protein n=1 Tax=Paramuricea clavata TaxID=317549 RepID=A0A7D9IJT0_PARCT|nr:Hypothetical predicted protein [Paramuricea clavata]